MQSICQLAAALQLQAHVADVPAQLIQARLDVPAPLALLACAPGALRNKPPVARGANHGHTWCLHGFVLLRSSSSPVHVQYSTTMLTCAAKSVLQTKSREALERWEAQHMLQF